MNNNNQNSNMINTAHINDRNPLSFSHHHCHGMNSSFHTSPVFSNITRSTQQLHDVLHMRSPTLLNNNNFRNKNDCDNKVKENMNDGSGEDNNLKGSSYQQSSSFGNKPSSLFLPSLESDIDNIS
jgi:hypothetical protein